MRDFSVKSSAGIYRIECAPRVFRRSGVLLKRLAGAGGLYVLSSPRVWRLWGAEVIRAVRPKDKNRIILFDDAEERKDLRGVELICRALIRAGADRHSVLVAVGGGVVGDVAGFVAASYLRGVGLVHIPTTVVAQVDSAIGGKTGVNLPEGKNLVGAFYSPEAVLVDPEFLQTLPHREFRSGLYEVVKYGVIADTKLFEFLEHRMAAILRRDAAALSWIIPRCIGVKARVVTADEREGGLRKILNFGHTLGHALEAATGYRRFLHGEAVGWGMMAATSVAVATARLREFEACRILRLIAAIGPLPSLGKLSASRLLAIMAGDKKSRGGHIRWVLPNRIGHTQWDIEVPTRIVSRAIKELPRIAAAARA